MLKNYMYAGILFGSIVLAGGNVNGEAQKQVNKEMTEGLSDSEIVELPNGHFSLIKTNF